MLFNEQSKTKYIIGKNIRFFGIKIRFDTIFKEYQTNPIIILFIIIKIVQRYSYISY